MSALACLLRLVRVANPPLARAFVVVFALCRLSIWCAADEPKPPPVNTDASKAFLSSVTLTKYGDFVSNRVIVPNAGRIQGDLYYDTPLAVHVPFEVPFQDRVVRIHYAVAICWPEGGSKFRGVMPDIGTYGIYRQDGKALADASVFYEDSWQPDSNRWLPLWFNASAPTPCWINGTPPPKAEYRSMSAPWYNEANFTMAPEERQMERPLVLKHAVPGDYVFWFSLMGWGENQGWPENVEADTLQVTVRVSLLVTAAEDRFHQEERLAYLFHGGPRPANLADNSLYRTYKIDVPLTLHRDGWVFDHVEIVPWKKEVDQKRLTQGEVATDIEAQTKVGARSAIMSLKTTTSVNRNGNQPQVICRDAFAWDATLPPSIDDRNVADVLIGGSEQHQWDPKEPLIRSLLVAFWQASAYESPDPHRYDDGVDLIRATGSEEKKTEFDLRPTGNKEEHERWWFNDPRPARQAPAPGQEPYRRRYYCRPPWRKAPQETLGAKLLINLWLGPWNVNGYYRRRSEGSTATLAAPGSSGPVEVVQNEDPFWKWYAAFSRLLREQLSKVELAKAEAGLIGLHLEEALRSNAILLGLLTDPDNQTSDAYFNRILKSEQSLAQQIRDHRQRIDAITNETRGVYNQILGKIEEGFDKFGEQHPELLLWEREYRDQRDQSPFSLAGAAGDIQALRKAAEQAEAEGLSARSRLIEADVLRRMGDPVGALSALREAARIDPEDAEVKQALTEAECAFLKTAIEKSQGAIKAARAAFYSYLMERGFGSADVNPHGEYHWYSFLTNPLSQLDSESAWAVFSTGAAGSLSSIFGKPEAEADLLKVSETQMTTAFLGLHTILRLRLRGHSLVEIQAMSSEQLRACLPLKDLNGQPFTDQQLHSLGVAVREALKLPDVQALVADDRTGLQLGLKNSYWDARDVGDTWLEWLGDSTSVMNLFMLLPCAKAGRLPTAIMWGTEALQAVERGAKAGEVISGTEFVARYIGLERALRTLGETSGGKALLDLLERSEKYQKSFGLVGRAGWGAGKVVATIALQTLAVHLADKAGGHKAALAMQALLLFGGDSELLIKMLRGKRVPLASVEGLIRTQVIPAAEQEVKLLTGIAEDSQQIRAMLDRVRQGKTLSQEEFVLLEQKFGAKWRQRVPNGSPGHDAPVPLSGSAEGIRNGADNGAIHAVEEMVPDIKEEAAAAAKSRADAEQLANDLHNAPSEEPLLPSSPEFAGQSLADRIERVTDGVLNYPIPPQPKPGSYTARAEAKLQAGDYQGAKELFERARQLVNDGFVAVENELPPRHLELKIALAEELLSIRAPKPMPGEASRMLSKAVDDTVAEDIFNSPHQWERIETSGVSGQMYTVKGNPSFLVKEVTGNAILQNAEAEMVAQELARELGFDVPGMAVRVVRNAQGEAEKAIFVMRKIEGKNLNDLAAGEIFRYKDELSRERALSVLLGDFDRKLDNYRVTSDGRLFAIDRGWADPRGKNNPLFDWTGPDGIPRVVGPDAESRMEGAFGLDHWLSRAYKDDIILLYNGRPANTPLTNLFGSQPAEINLRKILIAEEALTYNAAKPAIEAIEKLVKDEPQLNRLLEGAYAKVYGTEAEFQSQLALLTEANARSGNPLTGEQLAQRARALIEDKIKECVTGTVDTFKKRLARLDKVMQTLDKRIGIPSRAVSSLRPQGSEGISKIIFLHPLHTRGLRMAA